jgi:hypothetical protein
MKLAILSVVLWPKDQTKQIREVKFVEKGINVVTGKSGTGKSSLIHIVDYCLGSHKCSIPVGPIRQTVAWFGIVVKLTNSTIIIARRNPEQQEQTSDIYWVDADGLDLATVNPKKTMNTAELTRRFNEMTGISSLSFSPGILASGFKSPASFRDMAAFNFQPQHIVANPHAMFFKTDTFEHREKLITVFPLALGAISASQLAARWQLELVEADLKRKEAELADIRQYGNQWLGEVRGVYVRARELGLLPNSPPPGDKWGADIFLTHLRRVTEQVEGTYPKLEVGVTQEALARVSNLENQESRLSRQIADRARSLHRVRRLTSTVASYGDELAAQEGRLYGLGWFRDRVGVGTVCPLCGMKSDAAQKEIQNLTKLAEELTRLTTDASSSAPILDREVHELQRDIRTLEAELESVRQEKWQLEDQSVALEERRRKLTEIYRFVGRIEQALDGYWRVQDGSELQNAIAVLRAKASGLRAIADKSLERQVTAAALERFTLAIAPYIQDLQLERASDPVHLKIEELMLEVTSSEGRHDALWEIGSAENWMGYHIATMLALHQLFLGLPTSVVASFLMIDQPSQAYFPDRWPGDQKPKVTTDIQPINDGSATDDIKSEHAEARDRKSDTTETPSVESLPGSADKSAGQAVESTGTEAAHVPTETNSVDRGGGPAIRDASPEKLLEDTDAVLASRSEDIAGVRRIFKTLANAVDKCPDLQIIVTEHAGEITWAGVPHVHVVENWRPGKDGYLIPADWLANQS